MAGKDAKNTEKDTEQHTMRTLYVRYAVCAHGKEFDHASKQMCFNEISMLGSTLGTKYKIEDVLYGMREVKVKDEIYYAYSFEQVTVESRPKMLQDQVSWQDHHETGVT